MGRPRGHHNTHQRFTAEDRLRMITLRQQGLTYKIIGVRFGVTGTCVQKVLQREKRSADAR